MNLRNLDIEKLWEAYKDLQSLQKVADKFALSNKEGLRVLFKRNGYIINKLVINSFNKDFFKKENEKSFYWAGFIAADGCVKNKKNRYELSIALAIKDENHIKKFTKDINFDGKISNSLIKNSKRNSNWNDSWKSEIGISSRDIFDDLSKFNIVPRKSLIYTFPRWIMSHPLRNHFMRGYFDGDGSFYKTLQKGKKTEQEYFSLRGTSEFLLDYRNILEQECNLKYRTKPIRIHCNIGILEYGGNGYLSNIKKFLFNNADTYLDRKWNLYAKQSF